MVVYWEYAFAENFILDALLLVLALLCARARVRWFLLVLAAGVGAAEAVVFPLLSLPVWAAYCTKLLGGALLPVLALGREPVKTYIITEVAFFFLTFALGGLLTAAYSFFGVEYAEGNWYLVESAPLGLVLGGAGLFAVATVLGSRQLYRYRSVRRALVPCRLISGEREVVWKGFSDSGNCLEFRGRPACVLSARAAYVLLGAGAKAVGQMEIGTVNGSRAAPVYECERLIVGNRSFERVPLVLGDVPTAEYQLILHTAYTEGYHETSTISERMAADDPRKRKHRTLPVRK